MKTGWSVSRVGAQLNNLELKSTATYRTFYSVVLTDCCSRGLQTRAPPHLHLVEDALALVGRCLLCAFFGTLRNYNYKFCIVIFPISRRNGGMIKRGGVSGAPTSLAAPPTGGDTNVSYFSL